MANTIESTNNPLVILACLLCLALAAVVKFAANIVAKIAVTVAGAAWEHRKLLALLALPIVAVVAINFAWPFVVAAAGKLLVGGGATMAFAVVFRP